MGEIKEFYCPRCGFKLDTEEVEYDEICGTYDIETYCMNCMRSYHYEENEMNETLKIFEYNMNK